MAIPSTLSTVDHVGKLVNSNSEGNEGSWIYITARLCLGEHQATCYHLATVGRGGPVYDHPPCNQFFMVPTDQLVQQNQVLSVPQPCVSICFHPQQRSQVNRVTTPACEVPSGHRSVILLWEVCPPHRWTVSLHSFEKTSHLFGALLKLTRIK